MIEFKKCPVIDGVAYASIQEARKAQIIKLMDDLHSPNACGLDSQGVAQWIVENTDKIVDALTTDESSRPKARKINGGTKKRKPTVTPPAQTP